MKKKVNYLKIMALILMIIEICIIVFINKNYVKGDLNVWRIYTACVIFVPVNIMYIFTKRR